MGSGSSKVSRGVRIRTYASGKQALQIQFHFRGVQCRETLSSINPALKSSQRYAINLKAEIEARIERGTFVYTDYFPDSPRAKIFGHVSTSMTIQEAQDALLADLAASGIERTTLASYERSAARINGCIGRHRLVALTPADIRDMVRQRSVSRKTWNNDLIPLRRTLKRAVNDGVIQFSPLDRVELDELVPKLKRPAPDPFSLQEIGQVLDEAKRYCERSWNTYEALLFTGMRIEEMAALCWDDVDLVAGKLYITKAAQLSIKSNEPKPPKTAAGERVIDLLPRAAAALRRQRKITGFRKQHVFCRWQSMEPISNYDQLRLRWSTILKRAEVRHRPLRQTRHTYASHMLSSGQRELYVANQMGHKGTGLLDVYATWVEDWKESHDDRQYGT